MDDKIELDPETDYRKAQLRWRARRERQAREEEWDKKPFGRIDCHPLILSGKPLLRGTRISVEIVLGMLAGGRNDDEIFEAYGFLFKEDIEACIRFAATGARLSFWQEREREEENRERSLSEVAVGLMEKRGLSSDTGSQ